VTLLRSAARSGASTDFEALRRVAEGDPSALGEVYDRHARALLDFVARVSGRSEAEDVVHTVFLRAVRLAGTYDGRFPSARSWLYGITSKVIQERRRSFIRALRAMVRIGAPDPHQGAQPLEHRADLRTGLRGLSEAKRVVLLLADLEGFTCDEIARILGIPVGTVWTRLHHARRELRVFYQETV
jgi:RNA polymerase sigma factor (sigma-70 family)